MSSLYLLEDAVYFALQTSSTGSTIAKRYKQIKLNSLNDLIYDSENDRYMCKEIDLSFAWESVKPPIMVIKKISHR